MKSMWRVWLVVLMLSGGSVLIIETPMGNPTGVSAQTLNAPEPPRVSIDTSLAPPIGTTINVRAGDSLQSAFDQAQAGQEIVLEAGATFTGNFTLRGKFGWGWIRVRTSDLGGIPQPGSRIAPSNSGRMPKMVTPNGAPVLVALTKTSNSSEAHHYRFIGIEFTAAANITNLIRLGDTGAAQSRLDQVPHDLIFDRCYVHGTASRTLRRGIALNSAGTAIIDSYISDCHEVGADSQAICGWNGPGPFKIVNNYLEASGENVMFGGSDPSINGLIPSDIVFQRNNCTKPLSWKIGDPSYAGTPWGVKNLLELKNAQRVLIEGNLFENVWLHAQTGYAVLFKSVNQDGTAPWSVTQDVDFRNNVVRHVGAAINIQGRAVDQPGGQTKRVSIRNNLFTDVSQVTWNGEGALLKINDSDDVTIDHNTVIQSGNVIIVYGAQAARFVFTNNIAFNNLYGVKGDGTATGSGTLITYFPGCTFRKNALTGGTASAYPAGNFFPRSIDDIGFVDRSAGNYRLLSTSPLKLAGTDGFDVGANIDIIDAARGDTPPASGRQPTVVMYASDASVRVGNWLVTSDTGAAGGKRLVNSDGGAPKIGTPLASPSHYFEITFDAQPSTAYRLWVRGKAMSNSPYNDSVYVQFSGSVNVNGSPAYRIGTQDGTVVNLEDYLNEGVSEWGWQDNGWGIGVMGPVIYFGGSGPQVMRVQVREDGLSIDQIVLSAGDYLNRAPGALKNDSTILKK